MRIRIQPWQLAILVVALCAAAIWFVRWRKLAEPYDAPQLFSALPGSAAGTLLFVDVAKLRNGGILDLLAGSKAAEERDDRNFVEQTGFDYRTDLDAIAAVYVSGEVYLAVRGRFDWPQLSAYARSQGGRCQYTICTMPATSPERNISFYPIRRDVLALAVTIEERGVTIISPGQSKPRNVPPEPVWLRAPREALHASESLPAGVQLLLAPLGDAQSVELSAGPGKNGLRLRAEVALPSAKAAETLSQQFQSLTDALRRMSAKTAGAADLAGLLAKGSVEQKDSLVVAEWPLDPEFLKALASDRSQ